MSRPLVALLAVTIVTAPVAYGQAITQIVTSKSLPQATIDVIDPETGTSSGSGSSVRLTVGDVILLRTSFTPVASAALRGLQGYITEYLPPNTELIGVRIIDGDGRTIEPRYPGIAVDGCLGGARCNSFTSLPCSGGTCSFQSGSIAQVHADTGMFFSQDPRLARNPANSFLTMRNGILMSPAPRNISPSIVALLGDLSGSYYAHNLWDWAQVRAYGTSSAVSGGGGDGNTPYGYGSPVAGPDTFYQYEATEVSPGTIQFNNVVGPWTRIRYPGSTIGTGVGNIGASTNLTRALVDTTSGFDVTPATSVSARAVRIALGETRLGERGTVELALLVTGLPLDPDTDGHVACAEAVGSDISSRGGSSGGGDNPWPFYVGSPACADLRLQLDLTADKDLRSSGETVQYSLRGRNLAVTAETNAVVRLKYEASRQGFLSAVPPPDTIATCADDPSLTCLRWNVGTLQPSQEYAIDAAFVVGSSGHAYTPVYANHQSDQTPSPGRTTQVVTTLSPVAVPKITLAPAFDPTAASVAPGSAAGISGTVRNAGTASWNQDSITLVLPSGWSVTGVLTLGGVTLPCSAGCGTARPTYSTAVTYAPDQSRTLAFNVQVPAGTSTGLYRIDVQTWGSQTGAGSFETYFPRAAFVPIGTPRTQVPVVRCPIRNGTGSIGGTAEANATVSLQFNAIGRGTATAAGDGAWSSTDYTSFGDVYGGLEVTAVATALGKLESERSLPCFVTNFPCGRAPLATNTGPYCEGGTVMLAAQEVAGATYSWTGPNGFTSSQRAPVIAGAGAGDGGTYSVTITLDGCTSPAGTTEVVINPTASMPSDFTTGSASVDAGDVGVPYAVDLVEDVTYTWSYSGSDVVINGSGHSVTLDFHPTATSGTLTVIAENECGASGPRSLAITVAPPPLVAPDAVNASATGTNEVVVGWSFVPAATYEIFRSSGDGARLVPLATTSDTIYFDGTVTPNTTYLYAVRARRGEEASPLGPIDPATTVLFADDPLQVGDVCRAAHITQLRTAVDAMRAAAGLEAGTYTEDAAAGSPIRAVHVAELRGALDEARSVLELAPIVYTDPTITAGSTTLKAAHIDQLRNGVK